MSRLCPCADIQGMIFENLRNQDRGASMVEYGLIVAVIALMSISAVTLLGHKTESTFTTAATALASGQGSEGNGSVASSSGAASDADGTGNTNGADTGGDTSADDNSADDNSGNGASSDEQQQGYEQQADDSQYGQESGDDSSQGSDTGEGVDHNESGADGNNGSNGSNGNNGNTDGNNGNAYGNSGNGNGNGNNGNGNGNGGSNNVTAGHPVVAATSSDFFWWNDTKHGGSGAWQASTTFENDTNRHQYLTLKVTRVDAAGVETSNIVEGFYVPANGTATYTLWDNPYTIDKKDVSGVVEVKVEVLSVKTSDQSWKSYSYDLDHNETVVLPPKK
jgi:Flp pilus assembly pilin Flp